MMPQETLLRHLFHAAVAAADPMRTLKRFLPNPPRGRTIVLGAGKASARMAEALEAVWEGPLTGLVVTRYGHGAPTRQIRIVEAAHPVPDAAGAAAATEALAIAETAGPDDLVLCLISGGGSALWTLPAPGLTLRDLIRVNSQLLACGASIEEMNALRKHLSAIQGGRLACAAYPARVVTLAISDVPGDQPTVIASGPTVADPTDLETARAVVRRYELDLPASITARLDDPAAETPKPGDPRLAGAEFRLIAAPRLSLEAAAEAARFAGITPVILGDAIEGEAREVGRTLAGIARSVADHGLPVAGPAVLLSGGETTVTLTNKNGRGGRNQECLLGCGLQLAGHPRIWALAADTDGIDGSDPVAGGFWRPESAARARALGLDPAALLKANNAYTVFDRLSDHILTGPTLTNVNDFRAVLIAAV